MRRLVPRFQNKVTKHNVSGQRSPEIFIKSKNICFQHQCEPLQRYLEKSRMSFGSLVTPNQRYRHLCGFALEDQGRSLGFTYRDHWYTSAVFVRDASLHFGMHSIHTIVLSKPIWKGWQVFKSFTTLFL